MSQLTAWNCLVSRRLGAAAVVLLASGVACDGEADPSSLVNAASLPGSDFEIDDNANLILNGGVMDWATVDENRRGDKATGSTDDSYSGGSKEDDACPGVGTGSIPNNKSDLLHFGVFEAPGG